MTRKARLDAELVRRGLARSREHASELIDAGKVTVRGMVAGKPATGVTIDAPILVRADDDPRWASRGAYKLFGALRTFERDGLTAAGRRCLDAGASTGGFTDVLLREGASTVIAADVGRGLLDWRLRTDRRVVVLDKTNVRNLHLDRLGGAVEFVVADLSFISLRLVLPALAACARADADLVPMVKPQFEVGKERLGAGGVVRDTRERARSVHEVLSEAAALGLRAHGIVASPLPGPSGNIEYFAWLRRTSEESSVDDAAHIENLVRNAVGEGPS